MGCRWLGPRAGLGITSRGAAAIVFQPLATADFEGIVRDMEEVVRGTAADSGTTVVSADDPYGFRWLLLRGSALEGVGYGERVRNLRRPARELGRVPGRASLGGVVTLA